MCPNNKVENNIKTIKREEQFVHRVLCPTCKLHMSVISTWHSGVICLVAAVGCCGQITPSRFSGFLACFRLMVLFYLSRLISPELNTSSNLNILCSSWEKFAETKREITSVSSNKPKLNTSWVEKWANSGRDNKYGEEKNEGFEGINFVKHSSSSQWILLSLEFYYLQLNPWLYIHNPLNLF